MLSVIVPVRNEPDLTPFLLRLHEVVGEVEGGYEVLVVTGDRESLHAQVPVFPHQRVIKTYGDSLERSILNGFSHARGEIIVVLDADGSHPVEEIPRMMRLSSSVDLVVGSRYMGDSRFTGSLFRKTVSRFFTFLAHRAGSRLADPMSGFFMVRSSSLSALHFRPLAWKTALEVEMQVPFVTEFPIRFRERERGFSKASMKIGLKLMIQLLGVILLE